MIEIVKSEANDQADYGSGLVSAKAQLARFEAQLEGLRQQKASQRGPSAN
jgi:hypothetical protein